MLPSEAAMYIAWPILNLQSSACNCCNIVLNIILTVQSVLSSYSVSVYNGCIVSLYWPYWPERTVRVQLQSENIVLLSRINQIKITLMDLVHLMLVRDIGHEHGLGQLPCLLMCYIKLIMQTINKLL